jgi:hypothetical protein
MIPGPGSGQSAMMGVVSENEKERDSLAQRLVRDSDIDPALKDVVNGVDVAGGGGGGGDNVESALGDSPQSLPSLKSSGLLDWSSSRINGGGLPKQLAHGNNSSLPNPNSHSYTQSTHDIDARSTPLVSNMPVGLPWLANESR